MGVITEHVVNLPATKKRANRIATAVTFHADPNCSQITTLHARVLTDQADPEDAFTCDYCCDQAGSIPEAADNQPLPAGVPTGGRSGRRANQHGSANEPTGKQEGYVRTLLARNPNIDPDVVVATWRKAGVWTKANVSKLIDELKLDRTLEAPAPAPNATPTTVERPNRFAGDCRKCGQHVEAEAGKLVGSKGAWGVEHTGECPAAVANAHPEALETGSLEGMHRTPDGEIYKVQIAVHGSGHPYAKHLDIEDGHGHFTYEAGALRKLSQATKMSLEDAKAFGRLYGFCCVCAAALTDEHSIAAGIGPICAGRF